LHVHRKRSFRAFLFILFVLVEYPLLYVYLVVELVFLSAAYLALDFVALAPVVADYLA
jgi:hypothetical protein